jgi:hypothetical protein
MVTAVRSAESGGSPDRKTLTVALGDVALLTGLILVGQRSHGIEPLAEPLAALETAVPFLLGWFVMAALAGVYASDVVFSVRRTVRLVTVAWIAAANVGLIVRASSLFDGGATGQFPLVITGLGLLTLCTWRIAYAVFVCSRAQTRPE